MTDIIGYRPIYRIEKDGLDITDNFNDRTVSIEITLGSGGGDNDVFQIVVDDRDWIVDAPAVGAQLSIHLGYKEIGLAFMGIYEIDEITFEGIPKQIKITGKSASTTNLMKAQAYAQYDNKTVKDIVSSIGQSAGIQVEVHQSLANKKIPFRNQTGISNYHILHELERHFDAVAKVLNGRLVFMPRDIGQDAGGTRMMRLYLEPHHVANWAVKHNQRFEFKEVQASWWNKQKNTREWIKAPVAQGAEEDAPYRVNREFASQQEAQEYANARAKQLFRATGEAKAMLAKGDPWVREQMPVVFANFREGVNGSYIIETVTHKYTKQGALTTEFTARNPGDNTNFGDQMDDKSYFSPLGGLTAGSTGRVTGPV